jgi:hypothetical protein
MTMSRYCKVNPYGGPLKFVVPICKDCERKDKRIAELVKQQEEYEYNASCIISTKDKRIAELEDENNRVRIERSEFATAMDYRDKAAQREIDSLVKAVKAVITDLDTQCTNSHAVRLLRVAIGEDDE